MNDGIEAMTCRSAGSSLTGSYGSTQPDRHILYSGGRGWPLRSFAGLTNAALNKAGSTHPG